LFTIIAHITYGGTRREVLADLRIKDRASLKGIRPALAGGFGRPCAVLILGRIGNNLRLTVIKNDMTTQNTRKMANNSQSRFILWNSKTIRLGLDPIQEEVGDG
jgi:hypothetical protein